MPTKRAPRPAPAPDLDTERRILEAAHRVFVARGTAGARMQDIAREAGVNQALLHYYFRSKERLAEAAFRRAAQELFPPILAVLGDPDMPLADKVVRVVHVELDQLARTPYLPGYIISELTHHPERAGQLFASLTGRSTEGVAGVVLPILERQLRAAARAREMRAIRAPDFLVSLLSLCIFPFAARPMLCALFGWAPEEWDRFVARRRRELPELMLQAMRP